MLTLTILSNKTAIHPSICDNFGTSKSNKDVGISHFLTHSGFFMNTEELSTLFQSLKIPKSHSTVGLSNLIASSKAHKSLLIHRRLPDVGWSDVQIQSFLYLISTLDTNNKSHEKHGRRWCGVGEREGRIYSSLVAHRHYGLSHGMGRSGDITEPQPKAVGSSVLVQLTLYLTLDAMRRGAGLDAQTSAAYGLLLPLCTGMSMSLVLSSLRSEGKDVVLWSRIDQKSCFKAISTAGLQCIMVPTCLKDQQVMTDLVAMNKLLDQYRGRVVAVVTTTSCFAPRIPDAVDHVARLCAQNDGVAHIINHAYGLQCDKTCKLLNRACAVGRVDAIVCSMDKNFLVPVGGAIVVSPHETVIEAVGKCYAGRASSSPIVDLFITLMSMGLRGYQQLLKDRKALVDIFTTRFQEIANKYEETLLECPDNTISFAITLDKLVRTRGDDEQENEYLRAISKDITSFGAILFSRCISGTRVIPRAQESTIQGVNFVGFGSSNDNYPHAYLTAACAIGVTEAEIQDFFTKLDKAMEKFKKAKP
jgi:O-phospho-L-seryl-tRNASec:L-selenocysteinyl-tRNA synthase